MRRGKWVKKPLRRVARWRVMEALIESRALDLAVISEIALEYYDTEIPSAMPKEIPLQAVPFVYVFEAGGLYKIGRALSPEGRLRELQTGNAHKIEIIMTCKTSRAHQLETALHRRFIGARHVGEWFELTLDDLEWLEGFMRTFDPLVGLRQRWINGGARLPSLTKREAARAEGGQ